MFIDANGKDGIGRIVKALRALDVPTASILDLDGLCKLGSWPALLESHGVPKSHLTRLTQAQVAARGAFDAVDPRNSAEVTAKQLGLSCLGHDARSVVEALLKELEGFGIFFVPVGELESWFGGTLRNCAKSQLLDQALALLQDGELASERDLGDRDDVWAFLRAVGKWLRLSGDGSSAIRSPVSTSTPDP